MVREYGVEKMRWRYSPIPLDWSRIDEIAGRLAKLGVTECYYSFLHSGTRIQEPRTEAERADIILKLAERLDGYGMTLFGCWDDVRYTGTAKNIREASCVDARAIDRIYGLERYNIQHPMESSCGCTVSIEVANQKLLSCPHSCSYCYASPEVAFDAGRSEAAAPETD
jgi:hypothetical protein